MTKRQTGWNLALIGFILAGVCIVALVLLGNSDDPVVNGSGANDLTVFAIFAGATAFVLLLDVGAVVGLILLVVGLVMGTEATPTAKEAISRIEADLDSKK